MGSNWKYCTPEQGKRLVALGIDPESSQLIYAYSRREKNQPGEWKLCSKSENPNWDFPEQPAFCVSELGALLPHGIVDNSDEDKPAFNPIKSCKEDDETFNCMWLFNRNFNSKTEAEARASLLIWLLENNHTTAAECNKRLREVNG